MAELQLNVMINGNAIAEFYEYLSGGALKNFMEKFPDVRTHFVILPVGPLVFKVQPSTDAVDFFEGYCEKTL